MPALLRQSQWTSSQNSHNQEVTTPFSQSQTQTVQKRQSLSPVTRPLTQKELPYYTLITSFPTTAFPGRSSQTEMSVSYRNSHRNFVGSSASNRTSVQHITLKQMEQAKEPIKRSNNIYMSSVAPSKTIGMHGSHLLSIPKTHGPPQLQRKHHLTYS